MGARSKRELVRQYPGLPRRELPLKLSAFRAYGDHGRAKAGILVRPEIALGNHNSTSAAKPLR